MHKFVRFERWLIRVVILGFVALVVVQALMTHDPFRFYLSFAEKLDGEKITVFGPTETALAPSEPAPQEATGGNPQDSAWVTLEIINYFSLQKAHVLLNGETVADFREKKVTVFVQADDLLTLDASFYNHPFDVKVSDVSPALQYPKKYQVIKMERNLVEIGPIKVKNDPDS